MASSIVDKYEQILAADPRSRIFVELARALVDRGEHARAIEICRRGLEHHPSAILGRVTWGRALLESGDTKGAMDQFEIAIALEPASPYAYNHVGEVLLAKGMHREALPVLARAAELQPGDAGARSRLEDAKRRAEGEPTGAGRAGEGARTASDGEDGGERTEPYRPLPRAGAPAREHATGARSLSPRSAAREGKGEEGSPRGRPPPPVLARSRPELAAAAGEAADGLATEAGAARPVGAAPPPLPAGPPPARSVLYLIPDEGVREEIGPSLASRLEIPRPPSGRGAAPSPADPAAAEHAAAEYERKLREKLLAAPEPPPPFVHRHRRLVVGAIVGVALAAAGVVYAVVSSRNAALQAAGAATLARAGLARDTFGSLREAHRLLADARTRSQAPELASLAAQVAAVLAVEHGDAGAREAVRALAEAAAGSDGELVARYLLAEKPAERTAAEAALLAARPSSGALVQALAGRILVGRGETEGGRGRLEIAARANPPLLRALSDLGDLALRDGDPEGALALYGAALAAHPTHPRSALGAAEARLALGRDPARSRQELEAVDRDEASRPPRDVEARFRIAWARVEAALGDPAAGAARLARLAESAGESAAIAAALAELHLQARGWEKAEAAAARAVAREPRSAEHRVLLARARLGRGRYAEALAATEGADGRAVRVQRAIARYRLGQWSAARAELERTARDGKLAADAAVWFAMVDVASGRAARALPLVDRLTRSKNPPALVDLARGRALEALGRRGEAAAAYRTATEREPSSPEAYVAWGRLLLAEGRARDALAPLERGVKLDPNDVAARRLLGEARLAAGQPSAARADLDVVLLAAPKDAGALRLVSAAWLAEGQAGEARRAADRAVSVAPKDPGVLLAAARAALATGDGAAARKLADRALKTGAAGAERDEARRLATGALPRKR